MRTIRIHLLPVLTFAIALLGLSPVAMARPDSAVYFWKVTVTVPVVPPQPNDAHFIFTGTGGSIKNAVYTAGPAGAVIAGASNMVDIVWPGKMPAATVFEFVFSTSFTPVAFGGGTWTNDGNVIGNIAPGNVTVVSVPGIPTVSEWGLIVAALGLLTCGTILIRRWNARNAIAVA